LVRTDTNVKVISMVNFRLLIGYYHILILGRH
jgi:hypothetical protein